MARTLSRNTVKKLTSTKEDVGDVTETMEEKEITTSRVAPQKHFNRDDEILCRSVTIGGLHLDGPKSKEAYSWMEYGDEEYVQYQDLAAMVRNSRSDYIFGPLFIIEDEDFIEEFPQLKQFYDAQYTVKDLQGILDLPQQDMIATIEKLPNRARNSLKSIASSAVTSGQLDSLSKIKALDKLFGTELNLLSELLA